VSRGREDDAHEVGIVVNGEPHSVAAGSSVLDLLDSLDLHPRMVAVEYNGAIIRRPLFGGTTLVAGDRLELVRFVQGGALPC
jgi:thiamine biosynthesis protein ThiS